MCVLGRGGGSAGGTIAMVASTRCAGPFLDIHSPIWVHLSTQASPLQWGTPLIATPSSPAETWVFHLNHPSVTKQSLPIPERCRDWGHSFI